MAVRHLAWIILTALVVLSCKERKAGDASKVNCEELLDKTPGVPQATAPSTTDLNLTSVAGKTVSYDKDLTLYRITARCHPNSDFLKIEGECLDTGKICYRNHATLCSAVLYGLPEGKTMKLRVRSCSRLSGKCSKNVLKTKPFRSPVLTPKTRRVVGKLASLETSISRHFSAFYVQLKHYIDANSTPSTQVEKRLNAMARAWWTTGQDRMQVFFLNGDYKRYIAKVKPQQLGLANLATTSADDPNSDALDPNSSVRIPFQCKKAYEARIEAIESNRSETTADQGIDDETLKQLTGTESAKKTQQKNLRTEKPRGVDPNDPNLKEAPSPENSKKSESNKIMAGIITGSVGLAFLGFSGKNLYQSYKLNKEGGEANQIREAYKLDESLRRAYSQQFDTPVGQAYFASARGPGEAFDRLTEANGDFHTAYTEANLSEKGKLLVRASIESKYLDLRASLVQKFPGRGENFWLQPDVHQFLKTNRKTYATLPEDLDEALKEPTFRRTTDAPNTDRATWSRELAAKIPELKTDKTTLEKSEYSAESIAGFIIGTLLVVGGIVGVAKKPESSKAALAETKNTLSTQDFENFASKVLPLIDAYQDTSMQLSNL